MRKSSRQIGRQKQVKQSQMKRLLQYERLETRQLLAGDIGDMTPLNGDFSKFDSSTNELRQFTEDLKNQRPTHSYSAEGQDVGMVIYPKRLAIAFADGAKVDAAALDAMKLTFVRKVNEEFNVYDSVDSAAQLKLNASVREIVPVFFAQESGSEAVLLDELIVGLKPGVTAEAYFAGNAIFSGFRPLTGTPDQFVGTVAAGKGEAAMAAANAIDSDPRLTYVSPNFYQTWQRYYTPNDPRFTNLWHLHNTGQGGGLVDADSDLPEAWDVVQGGSPTYVVGVIDDGVVTNHPDINPWVNAGEIAGDSIDNDGNGWVDDINGWNFVSNNNQSGNIDANERHGTAVAGVAAARGDNALGVTGASYGSKVISGKMFEGTINGLVAASDANIAGALYYMAGRTANGLGTWRSADLVNNSWGGGANSVAINTALSWGTTAGRLGRGTTYLFATGNGFGAVSQPALQSLNIPGVIAVGATNNKGERSNYSNFGPAVDVVTPSNDTRAGYLAIDTTDRVGTAGYATDDYTGTGATGFGGTSSATPLATGITALAMVRADTLGVVLPPAQLRGLVRANTDLIGGVVYDTVTGRNNEFGWGRLNAASIVSNIGKAEISVLTPTTDLVSGVSVVNAPNTFVNEISDLVFRVRNQGTSVLNLSSLTVAAGPFSVLTGFTSTVLGIGGSTTFSLRFAPTAGGIFNRTVTIASNDSDEAAFVFNVSARGIAPSIGGTMFEDWDGDGLLDAQDPKLAGRTVFLDANNNGVLDSTLFAFTNSTPIPLPDLATASSTITVAGFPNFIVDVNVGINITHTFDADLSAVLISPSGLRIPLFAAVGGSGDNFTNTVLDDEAATAITAGTAPFTGSFRPTGSLALLDGVSANGVWTLEISDTVGGISGTLNNWRLDILSGEQSTVSRSDGGYAFIDLAPAVYRVRSVLPANWSAVGANLYAVAVASLTDSQLGRDFGSGRNNRFYGQVFDDVNGDGIFQSPEGPRANRVVFQDLNANGIFDPGVPSNFVNSTVVPVPDPGTVNSDLVVSGVAGSLLDVNVRVDISMTWNEDLDIFLVHPDGTRVELFTDVGGSNDNFTNTILDDQAATSITAGTAPFTGSFRPEGILATLNGKSGNGTWRLEVTDDVGTDAATLNNWELIFISGEVGIPSSSVGTVPFDLPNGNAAMRLAPAAGWVNTVPTDGLRNVVASGAPIYDQRFGTQLNVAPVVAATNASVVGVEGVSFSNTGTWGDPNAVDVVTLSASQGTVVKNANGTWSWSHTVPDDRASTTVTITATDLQGLFRSTTFAYIVNNAAPSLNISNLSVTGVELTTIPNSGTHGDVPADTVTLTTSHGAIVNHGNGTWSWSINTPFVVNQVVTVTARDEDGGVTNATFTLNALRNVTIDLPSASSNSIVIQKAAADVQVVDFLTSTVLFAQPLVELNSIRINGSDTQTDRVFVDYASGGFFRLPGGIDLRGQGGSDALTVVGTGNTAATHSVLANPVGQRQLMSTDGGVSNAVMFSTFENMTFNGLQSFNAVGTFDVGPDSFTISSNTTADLGTMTAIAGGRLRASRGIAIGTGESLSGFGTIEAPFFGDLGSNISLSGNLSIGDPSTTSGFETLGSISIGANTLTLVDADQATLGANAIVSGFGTIQTPNTSVQAIANSGAIRGTSAANPITVQGFVAGPGAIDNVVVAGTVSPGAGPANVNYGSATYAGNVIIEMNGPAVGTQYDRINHSGTATLGGSIEVRLDPAFAPTPGEVFTLLTATGGVVGKFASVILPAAPSGQTWEVGYTANSVTFQLIALNFTIQESAISENGGTSTAVISRSNIDLSQSLVVSLVSADTSEAAVPATVTIPAGQSSASFTINAIDDNLLDGSQVASISIAGAGYASVSRSISVTDYETVTFSIDSPSISERNGVASITLTRSNTDNALPLTVNFSNSDTTELSIPATVTIPANQSSVTFAVNAVDDNLLDGAQTVSLGATAVAYIATSNAMTITDYETVEVVFDKSSIRENGEVAIATVTRSNTDQIAAITVTLTNSDSSEASIPLTVTIPTNLPTVSFTLTSVDDTLLDGAQTVIVTSAAAGYITTFRSIDVTDVELISMTFDKPSISERGGTATGTLVRGNTDISLPITVNLINSDTTEATMPTSVTIPANQSSATFTVNSVVDNLLDGTQTVGVVANSPGYFSDLEYFDVTDAETFFVTFNASPISENGGTAIGTVTRSNTNNAEALTVTLDGNDPSEATLPTSVTIPAGQASATFTVTAVDDVVLDGDQLVTITASATQYFNGSGSITIADFESLAVVMVAASISEKDGTTTGRVTRSNIDIAQPLVVTISSSDSSEAVVPTTVTIPANESFATFTITAVDDTLLDGAQSVALTIAAPGYVGTTGNLLVTDSETVALAINISSMSEAGGSAIGTITRSNTDITQPLTVNLSSSLTSEATVPATVTIPANAASVTFAITAVDDSLLDGTQTVLIGTSSAGYLSSTKAIEITDSVRLSMTFDSGSISENGGSTTATVTRSNTNIDQPLTVQLLSSDTSEATVPASVTIPANQSSVTFTIATVDDTLLDGTLAVTITASATGYIIGNRNIDITDAETVSLSIAAVSFSESGGTTTGTVTRSNTDTALPLTVTLLSSDTTEVAVPTTVTIPANETSVTFNISAVDDTLLDGLQTAIITASASGYAGSTRSVEVTDAESLALAVDLSSISESGGVATGTITRSNTDRTQPITVTLLSSDASEAIVPVTVTIPAGQASATFAITAVDDTLLDGLQSSVITASTAGYANGLQTVSVTDSETLSIVFNLPSISESNGSTTATVTRSNTDITQPLTIILLSTDPSEAIAPVNVIIPANQSSVTFSISGVDDTLLDGPQSLSLIAAAIGYANGSADLLVSDSENLLITIDSTSIIENGGSAIGTVTRSNTDNSAPLTVTLTSTDASEATVPLTVTIPANQSSVSFPITGVDDSLLDGNQLTSIQANATGYIGASRSMTVSDAETLSLTMSVASISENGGSATGTVTRGNTDITLPLTVTLSIDDGSEATVPATVTIPANQSSVTFAISAVDDTLLDGSRPVRISSSAVGYSSATSNLDVADSESLSLSFDVPSISENGGLAVATITRNNSDVDLPLVVTLTSSDTGEATIVAQVTIPANQSSATFTILAVDDTLLDGMQVVTIDATSSGYVAARGTVEVADAESLTLTFDSSSIPENGGTTIATVTRSNSDLSLPLIVNLQSTDTSEATVPVTVTIPANQTSATFTITAVDDDLLDGAQAVSVSASSLGYSAANTVLSISDVETLSLVIDRTSFSERSGSATGTITRNNTDLGSPLTINLLSSDTTEASVPATVTIPANASSVTFAISSVDDALLDGQQVLSIQVSATNYTGSTRGLTVTDSEALSISIAVSSISEKNGTAIGTVSRSNTDTSQALVVLLVSADTTEATVPASVTIPANQSQATFTITAVNELLIDGDQTVQLTASATNYENGSGSLTVRDDDPNFPWQNARNRFDVNNDGFVSPVDALLVINALTVGFKLTPELPVPFTPVRYLDVNGDGLLSPIDALLVINELNRLSTGGVGEGESARVVQTAATPPQSNQFDAVIDMLAEDQVMRARRRGTR